MTPASLLIHPLRDIDLNSSDNITMLYQVQRNTDGKIIDFRLVTLNKPAVAIWGHVDHDLAGKSIRELVPPEEAAFMISQFELVVTFGRTVQVEMEIRWQNDQPSRPVMTQISKLTDDVVATSSVTKVHALSQQGDLMQTITQNSSYMIDMLEAVRGDDGKIEDFTYRMINQIGLSSIGLTEEQVVGQRLRTVYPDVVSKGIFDRLVAVVETGETYQHEVYFNTDYCEAWIDAKYIKHNDGVVTISFDLTEARLDERKQKQETELYKTILDTALTSISVLEAVREGNTDQCRSGKGKIIDFRYKLVNQERLRLAGHPESFFIGKNLTELFPGMLEAGVFDHWVEVVETRQPHQFEVHYTYDGFDDWSLCLGSPFGDGVVVSYTDITKQKQAELKALQQAELLNSIQNTSQIGISACKSIRDTAGTIVDFQPIFRNATASHLHRHAPNEPIEATLLEDMPSLKDSGVFDRYVQVVESGQPDRFEQHFSSGGLDGWFEFSVQPWDDGFVLNILDTTSLRQAEREKVKQSLILQQVIDNTQAGLVLANPVFDEQQRIIDFRYILTNEYNAQTTGKSVAEMMGALVSDLFPDWQHSDLFRRYVDVVETGKTQRLAFPYEAYGMKGWFDGSFSCVDGCILYTYTDVTALKEAELAQQRYAELLEQVMNMTPAAIVLNESIRDEAGEIVDLRMMKLNQMGADLLQNSIEKVQFRRVSKYIPGSLDTTLFKTCRRVIETGEPSHLEVPWADHWYDFSLARFGDGIILTAKDITPMREYRQKLELANFELKRSNENLQSFAFVSSHDLQEPLRKIISFTNILQTQYRDEFNTELTDIIQRINTSADRMRLLIQDLLAYSKLETHQDLFKPVSITRLILELQEHELWVALNQSGAQIHLGELPTFTADPSQMRQLFQNLLSNAIKFCSSGVTPVISVSSRIVDRSEVHTTLPSFTLSVEGKAIGHSFYEIAVTDNGIGFDEKYVDRIFQVFQRLHGRSQHPGSGIGLAICQKIVDRHGGAISARSKPGEGSTFLVYLPVWK